MYMEVSMGEEGGGNNSGGVGDGGGGFRGVGLCPFPTFCQVIFCSLSENTGIYVL
jgi:hypothetical protein